MPDACHAIVIMGVSGAGKTAVAEALAKRRDWIVVDGDAFHPASNVEKMRQGTPLTDDDRWPWLQAIAAEIDRQHDAQKRIVIACSALKRAYRKILTGGRPGVKLVYLQGERELIMSRLQSRRGHYFPARLLDSQLAALEEPGPGEQALVIAIDKSIEAIVDEIVQTLEG